jgi:hypothetical protein
VREFLLSILTGLLSGVIVSWFFYELALRGQRRDLNRLLRLHRITLKALESAGFIEVDWDSQDDPTGIVFRVKPGGGWSFGGGAQPAAAHHETASGGHEHGGAAGVGFTPKGDAVESKPDGGE